MLLFWIFAILISKSTFEIQKDPFNTYFITILNVAGSCFMDLMLSNFLEILFVIYFLAFERSLFPLNSIFSL
jgi:hypothetical protein